MIIVRQEQLKLSTMLFVVAMVAGTASAVGAATASWDPNTEPDLAGYKLSYGTQPGVHTVVIDVGNVTTYEFNPPAGKTYYVVVQAYNTAGELSEKSNEVEVDIPLSGPPPVPTQLVGHGPTQLPPPVANQSPAIDQPSDRSSAVNGTVAASEHKVEDYIDVPGDFDGDGRPDLATYRRSSSEWRIWTSGTSFLKPTVMVWGMAGDRPVAADYNGDRITDFAVYRPSTGTWHLSLSGTQTPLALHWGGPEDVPVPLDHDGDGKADLGLIRNGRYEILLSSSNYLKSVQVQ